MEKNERLSKDIWLNGFELGKVHGYRDDVVISSYPRKRWLKIF